MTVPLSIGALWRETFVAARAGMPLYLPVAAAFVLLPGVVIDLFGPAMPKTPAGLTPNLILVGLALPSLIGLVAQAAIVRLAIDQRRGTARSVGEALLMALRLWPMLVITLLLVAVPIAAGMMLLVVPGIYVAARLVLAMPLVIDAAADPIAAVRRSWTLSDGNGWRIFAFTVLWAGWFLTLSVVSATIGSGVAALLGSIGAGPAGAVVASVIGGCVGALYTVFNAVGVALVYLRLRAA